MERYVMIDATGTVVAVMFLAAGVTSPAGAPMTLVQSDTGDAGDTYADGVFTPAQGET
jgi:hypothetical protein